MKQIFLMILGLIFSVFVQEVRAEGLSDLDQFKKVLSWHDRISKKEAVVKTDDGKILDDLIEEELTIFKLNSGKLLTGKVQLPGKEGILTVRNGRAVSQEKYDVPQTGKIYQIDEVFPDQFNFYKTKFGQPFTGQIETTVGFAGDKAVISIENGSMVKMVSDSRARGTKVFQIWKDNHLISSEEYLDDVKVSEVISSGRVTTEVHYDFKGRRVMEYDFPYNSSFADEYIEMRFYAPDGRLVRVNNAVDSEKSWCLDNQFKRTTQKDECLDVDGLWNEDSPAKRVTQLDYLISSGKIIVKTVDGKVLKDLIKEEQDVFKLKSNGKLLTGRLQVEGLGVVSVKEGLPLLKSDRKKNRVVPLSDPSIPQTGKIYQEDEVFNSEIVLYKTRTEKLFTGTIESEGEVKTIKDGLEIK